jgi:sulfotransferase family protein
MTRPDDGRPAHRAGGLRARLHDTPVLDAWRFATSLVDAVRWRSALRDVRTYALFVGHGRSGHSIVGSLIDAHPEAIVSDELDAVRYLDHGFHRDQILALSIARSARQAKSLRQKAGREGRTYSYLVPGWANGRFERLRVVGDTRAGGTVHRMATDPGLLERVDPRMRGLDVRYLHVIRNPYDNISTMTVRRGRALEEAIDGYLADCDALVELRRRIGPERLHDLRHEDLVTEPRASVEAVCRFLGLECPPGYLDACAGILFASPSRSRSAVAWTPEQIARVASGIEQIDFLAGYSFEA